MDVLPDALEQLTTRLEAMERRVITLESLVLPSATPGASAPVTEFTPEVPVEFSLAQVGGAFPVLGKAMLGIAGAYLLRAVAESGALPRPLIAALAIVYALLWLVAAARVPVEAWFAETVFAGTSALILAPMLWELTLSFKVLSAPAAAAILGGFVIAATITAWKQDRTPIYWVANTTAAAAALALSVATHQLIPFLATMLWMALTAEISAALDHQRSVRPLVAAAANLAVWALIFIYASPANTRLDYPAISNAGLLLPGCLLFLIYAPPIVFKTFLRALPISVFETVQVMIAFFLASASILFFVPFNGEAALGALCLLISLASYTAVFLLFEDTAQARNFHIFALWAACLLVTGIYLSMPPLWVTVFLAVAAFGATLSCSRLTLHLSGLAFLLTAAITSGLLKFVFAALAGSLPAGLSWGVCLVSSCAILCYAASIRRSQEIWMQQWINLMTAALAVFSLAAILVNSLLRLVALYHPFEAHHTAFIRTLALCAAALALASSSFRWHRIELLRIAYATLGLIAVKLLLEDLPLGHMGFIAAAVFLFALTLIAVPRLARMGTRN
jgi:hypothetical protein